MADVLGSSGDPTVLEYITSCLEDFDLGDGGEEAYESFGPMMVCMRLSHLLSKLERNSGSCAIVSAAIMCSYAAQQHTSTASCVSVMPSCALATVLQVDAGLVANDAAARAACAQLAAKLGNSGPAAPEFRALQGQPGLEMACL